MLIYSFPEIMPFIYSVSSITEAQAKEALLSYVAEHCCYGKKAAADIQFTKITPTSAMHVGRFKILKFSSEIFL